jgi:hypothetical protein
LEEIALLINVPQARKPTGFRAGAGFVTEEEDEQKPVSSTE